VAHPPSKTEDRYWNAYPGARVDSDAPLYQLFDRELWADFSFTERYPARDELCRYFDHIDGKIGFSRDTEYNKRVVGARFDEGARLWTVRCEDGAEARARWFIPAIGFAAKAYIPTIKGAETFAGEMHHTAVSVAESRRADVAMASNRRRARG
jgi:cation diffusion facilitator CzcD-associated flavoprotein CzcO